jgi:hypothetical protein
MTYVEPVNQSDGDTVTLSIWDQNVVANIKALRPGAYSGGYVTRSSTNLLYAPASSNKVYCYESGAWIPKDIPDAGITVACTGLTASTLYYLYVYDSSGTLTLDLTSATAPTSQNGVLVKNGATGRLFLAYCYSDSSGAVKSFNEDATVHLICNVYNKRLIAVTRTDTTASWTYQGNWRSANNSTSNRVQIVTDGLNQVLCTYLAPVVPASGSPGAAGIGLDSTSADSAQGHVGNGNGSVAPMLAIYTGTPGAGFHFLQALEGTFNNTSGVATFGGRGAGGSGGVDYDRQMAITAIGLF